MSLRLQGQQALSFSSRPCFCYTQIPASHWLRPTHMYKHICLCSHGCSRSNGWCIAACKAGLSVGFNSLSQRSNRTTAMHVGPDHWPAQQHSIKAALSPGTLTQPSTGKQQREKNCFDLYWQILESSYSFSYTIATLSSPTHTYDSLFKTVPLSLHFPFFPHKQLKVIENVALGKAFQLQMFAV